MDFAKKQRSVLLVEDSDDDYEVLKRLFSKIGVIETLVRVKDGEEALEYLSCQGSFVDVSAPCLVLLDLNLPGTDGHTVLETVKKDSGLKKIPVVVLTTSDSPNDIEASYRAGANAYVRKPVGLDEYVHTVTLIKQFWLDLALESP